MTSAMIWILVAVVVYLLGMLAIGFKYANNILFTSGDCVE